MKHLPEFPHVCSIPFCLSAHLPSSHFLSFFLSLFLPPFFLSPLSSLAPSCLPPRFVPFLSRATSPSVAMELCILQPFPLLSPESTHLLTPSTAENKRVFVSVSLRRSSWIDKSTATHTHVRTPANRTVVRFCL